MIWDGDCHFCRRWIERLREETGDRVQYEPSQQPEFNEAVVLVLPNGEVYRGAEAVFRSISFVPRRRWLLQIYKSFPGAAPICNAGYRFIAKHRQFASLFTRLLWGNDVSRPRYFTARRIFLRGLGLVYLIAFVSLWVQIDGLIGERGILPARDFFRSRRSSSASRVIFHSPTPARHSLVSNGTSCYLRLGFSPSSSPRGDLRWPALLPSPALQYSF